MNLAEFKSDESRITDMRRILEDLTFQLALEVCLEEGPLKKRLTTIDPNRILGRIEGYDEFMTRLKGMGEYKKDTNVDNPEVNDV